MNILISNLKFYILLLSVLFLSSCEKTVEKPDYGKYGNGILISNEGTFNAGNGSISYYDPELDTVFNEIFQKENNRSLGDIVQSVNRIGDFAFIQVNNSNKIEVVDAKSFQELGVIQNLPLVRYAIGNENTAYASAWGNWGMDGKIYFIDTKTLSVTDSVATGQGPEAMLLSNDKLFVANSGGWSFDNTISVIDPENKSLLETIEVGANPTSFVLDKANLLWVLCSGSVIYDENWAPAGHHPSKLVQIDPVSLNIIKEVELFENEHPSNLKINPEKNLLYIGAGMGFSGIYTLAIDEQTFNATKIIEKSFYGFDVNPDNGNIFGYEALNYTDRGTLYRYNSIGSELGNYQLGIAPNGSSLKRY